MHTLEGRAWEQSTFSTVDPGWLLVRRLPQIAFGHLRQGRRGSCAANVQMRCIVIPFRIVTVVVSSPRYK